MPPTTHTAVFDLDIGSDVDDTLVAAMIARDPARFRPALLLTNDETPGLARARFLADLVARFGAAIPVAAGLPSARRSPQCLVERAGLVPFAGPVFDEDGVAALEGVLERSPRVVYFGLGALTNLAAVLRRRPELAARVELWQMGPALTGLYRSAAPQHNARIDPAGFRDVLREVKRPRLLMSHTSWARFAGGRLELGVYPDDPLGRALASADHAGLRLCRAHLEAWVDSGKDCSIMHDPLTVASCHQPGIVDYEAGSIVLDDQGGAYLTAKALEALRAAPPDHSARLRPYLDEPPATPAGKVIEVELSLGARYDAARAFIARALFGAGGDAIAKAWGEHNAAL